jgi:hypothetical protein
VFYGTPSYASVKAQVAEMKLHKQKQQKQLQQEQEQQTLGMRTSPSSPSSSKKKKKKTPPPSSSSSSSSSSSPSLSSWKQQQREQQAFQTKVAARNERVFAAERDKREEMRQQAHVLRTADPFLLRAQVPGLKGYSDAMLEELSLSLEKQADSPHPLPGFWDGMGHPLDEDDDDDDDDDEGEDDYDGGDGEDDDDGDGDRETDDSFRDAADSDTGKEGEKGVMVEEEAGSVDEDYDEEDEDAAFMASVSARVSASVSARVSARVSAQGGVVSQGVPAQEKRQQQQQHVFEGTVGDGTGTGGGGKGVKKTEKKEKQVKQRNNNGDAAIGEEQDRSSEEEAGNNADDEEKEFQRRVREKKTALLQQAELLRQIGPAAARKQVFEFRKMTDEEVLGVATTAERTASTQTLLEAVVKAEMMVATNRSGGGGGGGGDGAGASPPAPAPAPAPPPSAAAATPQKKKKNQRQKAQGKSQQEQQQHQQQHQQQQHQQHQQQQHQQHQQQQHVSEGVLSEWRRLGVSFRTAHPASTEAEAVAVGWSQAASEHEKQGRRAFSGVGYQEQHAKVDALIQGWRSEGGERGEGLGGRSGEGEVGGAAAAAGVKSKGGGGNNSPWGLREYFTKAIYGPDWSKYV